MLKFIGTMSGTSADGVDVALAEIGANWPRPDVRLVRHRQRPYPSALRRRIFAARSDGTVSLAELANLGRDISLEYAAAVNEAIANEGWSAAEVAAIAAHGQTLYHNPPATLQWLDPALLASQTGCAVVSDFRRADCAVGGQGAPLVPFADWILFTDAAQERAILNLGGIANVTHLPPNARLDQVIAFDTGPANCLSDWLCRTLAPDGPGFDPQGRQAMQGNVLPGVADRFLAAPYFSRKPPKSTDGPEMIHAFQEAIRSQHITPTAANLNDLLATAASLTAQTLWAATADWHISQWILSGGGIHNQAVMKELSECLGPKTTLQTTEDFAIPSEAKEALAFALLAAATLARIPSNVPTVTGATRPMILGSMTPRQPNG